MTSNAPDFNNIKKILVIKFRHIGDVLLSVPTIRALKDTFPGAEISVLVNSGTEDVLAGSPLIDELIVYDRKLKQMSLVARYFKEFLFLKKIRGKRFDMTVDLTGGDRAAVVSFVSGAKYRLVSDPGKKGFTGKRFLYTHLAEVDKTRHMALQNLDIVSQFGITTDNPDVDMFIPEDAESSVQTIFKQNGIMDGDTVVHVHPTSRWFFKCWKDEYMAEVLEWLIDKGLVVIVTSAPDKTEKDRTAGIMSLVSSRITRNRSRLVDLSGRTTIKELAAISAASSLFIGVDSAPMHIAAAVKTPVIALFGPTWDNLWGPYGNMNTVIVKQLPCKPCKKGSCADIPLRECMTAIKPDDVKEAVEKALKL